MKVIGLTGKACSGKNYIATTFEKKGYIVVDVDKLGHKALNNRQVEIVEAFGDSILNDGKIDRKRLGNIVFSSKKKLKLLESIVHPEIKLMCFEIINKSEKNVVLNAAILQRGKLLEYCDFVVFVSAPLKIRYNRSKKRDKRSLIWFLKRNLSQIDINIRKLKKVKEVFVIYNKKDNKEIYRQIDNFCDIFNLGN